MDLLNALLDLVDAVSAGLAVTALWYMWLAPPEGSARRRLKRGSEPDELEQFLRAAALIKPSRHRLT